MSAGTLATLIIAINVLVKTSKKTTLCGFSCQFQVRCQTFKHLCGANTKLPLFTRCKFASKNTKHSVKFKQNN